MDDEEDLAHLKKEGLELSGSFEVDIFNDSGKELLKFRPNKYDLILVDILMPNVNGFDFYKLIKEKDVASKICFISAAEYEEEDIKNKLALLEIQNQKTVLIRKPIRLKELFRQVSKIINENTE